MSIRKIAMLILAALVSLVAVAPAVYAADDHGKACKADTDCEHGEHCKDGHCHK